MAHGRKVASVAFFIGIIFFAGGIFFPNTFDITIPEEPKACIAIFPVPQECLPNVIDGWFAIGVSFFLIGGLFFVRSSGVNKKDFGF
jgi:hypothetical protein